MVFYFVVIVGCFSPHALKSVAHGKQNGPESEVFSEQNYKGDEGESTSKTAAHPVCGQKCHNETHDIVKSV